MSFESYIVNVEGVVWHKGRYLMIVRGDGEAAFPGTLTPPGGKVEGVSEEQDVLESTLRRELAEEAGITVGPEVAYVESHAFVLEDGGVRYPVVDIIMLCTYAGGEPRAVDPGEVAGLEWLTYDEIMADPRTMPWTKASMELAERARRERGW